MVDAVPLNSPMEMVPLIMGKLDPFARMGEVRHHQDEIMIRIFPCIFHFRREFFFQHILQTEDEGLSERDEVMRFDAE